MNIFKKIWWTAKLPLFQLSDLSKRMCHKFNLSILIWIVEICFIIKFQIKKKFNSKINQKAKFPIEMTDERKVISINDGNQSKCGY